MLAFFAYVKALDGSMVFFTPSLASLARYAPLTRSRTDDEQSSSSKGARSPITRLHTVHFVRFSCKLSNISLFVIFPLLVSKASAVVPVVVAIAV